MSASDFGTATRTSTSTFWRRVSISIKHFPTYPGDSDVHVHHPDEQNVIQGQSFGLEFQVTTSHFRGNFWPAQDHLLSGSSHEHGYHVFASLSAVGLPLSVPLVVSKCPIKILVFFRVTFQLVRFMWYSSEYHTLL